MEKYLTVVVVVKTIHRHTFSIIPSDYEIKDERK